MAACQRLERARCRADRGRNVHSDGSPGKPGSLYERYVYVTFTDTCSSVRGSMRPFPPPVLHSPPDPCRTWAGEAPQGGTTRQAGRTPPAMATGESPFCQSQVAVGVTCLSAPATSARAGRDGLLWDILPLGHSARHDARHALASTGFNVSALRAHSAYVHAGTILDRHTYIRSFGHVLSGKFVAVMGCSGWGTS